MNKIETELIIQEVLYRRKGITDGRQLPLVDEMSRSVAKSVDYAPDLKGISPQTVRAAAEMVPLDVDYKTMMQYLRETFAVQKRMTMVKEPSRGGFTPVRPEEDDLLTNWGFLLRCRDAWMRDGDLGAISDLTVSYTARWILSDIRSWLTGEDARWCEDKARHDKALYYTLNGDKATNTQAETAYKRSYEEAIVSLTMQRIDQRTADTTDTTNALLNEKRAAYEEYFVRTRGEKPDWTVSRQRKPPRCSALRKDLDKRSKPLSLSEIEAIVNKVEFHDYE